MALNSINTNVAAYFAQANISKASSMAATSIGRLSSGERITKASDDVAALSVGTSLRTQVTTLRMALINTSQGSSMLQVADGALAEIQNILQRQKAIAVQAGSGSLTDTERGFLNQEFQNLTSEIDRIASATNFNGVTLLGGGLGSPFQLAQLDATAAFHDPGGAANTGFSDASTTAIEAFNTSDGTTLNGAGGPGALDVVDSTDTVLADGAYNSVSKAVYGKISKFEITNVSYAVAGTLTVTLNGIEFSGTFADMATTVAVENGSTRILLAMTALDLTDDATTNISQAQLYFDYTNTTIMHTGVVQGVDFTGTRLADTIGANGGIAMIRTANPNNVDIGNFKYVGNDGTDSTLTVEVNGEIWTAAGVTDTITDGDIIVFEKGNGESLTIDFTRDGASTNTDVNDIRLNLKDRTDFINALNVGFSRSGGGLNFNVGSQTTDVIRVQLESSDTDNIFNGESLSVGSAADAEFASGVLDAAIKKVTAIRAQVGSLQSRFDFAAANVESSIQNQDAARGVLLDTDIAAESTSFATAQVQVQAGISVLAQANLLPQNLLKLIG